MYSFLLFLEGGEELFTLQMCDGTKIRRMVEFVTYLMDHGCSISCNVRVASAVMGSSYSLLKETFGIQDETQEYFDVPFAFFTRTGIHSEKYQTEVIMPLLHSGLNLTCEGHLESFGDISFRIQYYMSMGQYTKWNARNNPQDDISWNKGKILNTWSEREDVLRICRICCFYAAVLNDIGKRENLFSNGYGLLGVCIDSVAPIQYILDGKTTIYPIMAAGEYRIRTLRTIDRLREKIINSLLGLVDSDFSKMDISDLDSIYDAVKYMPNDNYLCPSKYEDTLKRIRASLPWEEGEEPFVSVTIGKKIIDDELANLKFNRK